MGVLEVEFVDLFELAVVFFSLRMDYLLVDGKYATGRLDLDPDTWFGYCCELEWWFFLTFIDDEDAEVDALAD